MRTAVLISGSGTNLQAFIDQVQDGRLDLALSVVFSNRPGAGGLERAKKAGIETRCIDHTRFPDRASFDHAVAETLDRHAPELLILAGFMRILSPGFVHHYRGRILNIHPALLPRYPGLDTHQRVLDAGDSQHGSTVHFVTDELDGGPRILAGRTAVLRGETAAELCRRIQAIEHQIYPEAARWFAAGRIRLEHGTTWLDDRPLREPLTFDFDASAVRCD